MQKPVILWRQHDSSDSYEQEVARDYLPLLKQRTNVKPNDLVVGRYSVLPFYKELEIDVKNNGGELINSFQQHQYVADLQNWYSDLEDLTPKTWFRLEDVPQDGGPFVLKGETNSRKFLWNTQMFAPTKADASSIAANLLQDSLLSTQRVYVRQYVPLITLAKGLNDLPITEEYRFFVLDGQVLSGAFYWSSHAADLSSIPDVKNVPSAFLRNVIDRVSNRIRFVVIDVAHTAEGDWIVIELNDGQMSGLSLNDPHVVYSKLASLLK